MAYETILLDIADGVATITLNRPERLNACSLPMAGEISDALDHLGDARVLVLKGAGRAFCSGADLQARGDRTTGAGEGSYLALQGHYNPAIMKLARLNLPIISAVNGAAAGVGCSIALTADFVVAGKSGYFLQAFVNIGLVPDGGASWTLPRLIGRARAFEMMMLGERVPAAKALDWGLVHKVVADEALDGDALALAQRLAAGPTVALGLMRRGAARALDLSYAEAMALEAENQRHARRSADAVEGGRAFLEKRKAAFTGL